MFHYGPIVRIKDYEPFELSPSLSKEEREEKDKIIKETEHKQELFLSSCADGDFYTLKRLKAYAKDDILTAVIDYERYDIANYLIRVLGFNKLDEEVELSITGVADGYLFLLKFLHSKGYDIRQDDDILLTLACQYGHLNIVKYLVSLGADITAEDNEAVRLASRYGHLQVVKYLVSHGADVTAQNNYPLNVAAEYNHFDVVKYLVSQNKYTDYRDAIAVACRENNIIIFKYLIDLEDKISVDALSMSYYNIIFPYYLYIKGYPMNYEGEYTKRYKRFFKLLQHYNNTYPFYYKGKEKKLNKKECRRFGLSLSVRMFLINL